MLMRFGDGAFPGQDAVVSGMSRAFVTSHSVAGTPPAFSPEDVAEHEDRIGRLRALMDEHGFDAVIANDVGAPGAYPAYARYLSNFTIGRPGHVIAVVPRAGEPTLLVAAGYYDGFFRLAEQRSWIRNVVPLTVPEGLAYTTEVAAPQTIVEARMFGPHPEALARDVSDVVRTSGLDDARIGVIGVWPGLDQLKAACSRATFEPTLVTNDGGQQRDLLGALRVSFTPWEVERLNRAHAAADRAVIAYAAAAYAGSTIREAANEARIAAYRAGADVFSALGAASVDPTAFAYLEHAPTGLGFEPGHLYCFEASLSQVDGYGTQSGRTLAMGSPTKAQQHLHDVMERAVELTVETIEVGKAGHEVFEVVNAMVEAEDIVWYTQFAHTVERARPFSVSPGSMGVACEGHLVEVHAALVDPATGDVGFLGDSFMIKDGEMVCLSPEPLARKFLR